MKNCSICGKKKASGNNVSHSKRRTKRTFDANLHKKYIDDSKEKQYICTRCLRNSKNLNKQNLVINK